MYDWLFIVARKFSRILRLQMSLNHLCQASRSVVSSADIMSQMLDDWQAIDRKTIIKQTQLTLSQKDMLIELSRINHCTFINLHAQVWVGCRFYQVCHIHVNEIGAISDLTSDHTDCVSILLRWRLAHYKQLQYFLPLTLSTKCHAPNFE